MEKKKVMVNGLPGNMAHGVAAHVISDERFDLIPYSLTGPDIDMATCIVNNLDVTLIPPHKKNEIIKKIIDETDALFITVDYTHPSAVNDNAAFYCEHHLPFVMGTTGGKRSRLLEAVAASGTHAVIAPNMAKQIVGLQAMMAHAAENFPGLFRGYTLELRESHQKGKADTSGTAKAMVGYFNAMGIPFSPDDIKMERDPEIQKNHWNIPEEHLNGHAWHTYTLRSEDDSVLFSFTHNVNGREVYHKGTLDAISFLAQKIAKGTKPRVYSMIDVLGGE